MVLGIVFGLLGIGLLIAIMFNMAVFALPSFVAVIAGRFAFETGAGAPGAIAVGLLAGVAAFAAAQVILVMTRSTPVRIGVALAFTAPAAVVGYHVVLGLARIGGVHGLWQPIFAGAGAVIIGIAALMRLSAPLVPAVPPARAA